MRSFRRFALPTCFGPGNFLSFAALLAGVSIALFVTRAGAQPAAQYRSDEIDGNARNGQGTARGSVKDPARYAAEKAKVDEYFTKYYFPAMTRTGPQDFEELGKLRYELFNTFLRPATHEAIQKDITQAAFTYMARVVTAKDPPYHPAVRYNAVLILGMLDQQYAIEGGGSPRPPQPLPAANTFLVRILDEANKNNPIVTPALVVGSLVGLQRHAQFRQSLSPEAVAAMSATVLKLATREEPIQEADRDTMAWIRLRAAEVLAQLGSVGQDGEIHNAILKLVDTSRSLDDRCAVAAQLAKIKYEGVKVDPKATADAVFKLARDVAEAERTRATDFEEHRIGNVAGGLSAGGPRTGFDVYGAPEPYARRPMLARVMQLRAALLAVAPVLPADIQPKVEAIVKATAPVIEGAGDKDTGDLNLTGRVKGMADAIDRATPKASDSKEEMEAVLDVGTETPEAAPSTTEAPAAATDKPTETTPAPPAAAEAPPATVEPPPTPTTATPSADTAPDTQETPPAN